MNFDEFGWNVPYLYVNIYVCIYINYRQKLKINKIKLQNQRKC